MVIDEITLGLLCIFCFVLRQVSTTVLLYKTHDQQLTQSFDCIYYGGDNSSSFFTQSIEYCIRTENYTQLDRNYSQGCLNSGLLFTFSQLEQMNVSYVELLSWSSGIDAVDRYQTYLNTR